MKSRKATIDDLPELLLLQKEAFTQEAELYNNHNIQPLIQKLPELQEEFLHHGKTFLVMEDDDEIIASVRALVKENKCVIQKLMVHPDYQGGGLGKQLMGEIESLFSNCDVFELFTGEKSERSINFYNNIGYSKQERIKKMDNIQFVYFQKQNPAKILKKTV